MSSGHGVLRGGRTLVHVLGRHDELAVIETFLSRREQRVLLIGGELGIGKTALWGEGRARAASHRLLVARPVESETPLGFAGLGDLFQDVSDDMIATLPEPQQRALQIALLRADPGDDAPDPRSVAVAALGVLRALAATGPVLIAIDDVVWLDPATAAVLSFALRRLGEEPIRVLETARADERGALPALVTDVLDPAQVAHLVPAPLSLGAVRALLDERLGVTPSRRVLAQLYEMSGGNPYFALELGRSLGELGEIEPGSDLPLPATLSRLVQGRIGALPADVRHVLLLAALAPGTPADVVVAAGPPSASAHLEAAAAAGIIELRAGQVAFAHPLLRSVVIGDATPSQRRAAHARLAETALTSIARAGHAARAAARPQAAVATMLDDAAREAHLQGACETAAELAELALTSTPRADTPDRSRRMTVAAEYRFESGDPARARALADELLPAVPERDRAEALSRLATYQRYCGEPVGIWSATLDQALALAPEDDLRLRLNIHLALAMGALNGGDPATAPVHVRAMDELSDRCPDSYVRAQVAAATLWIKLLAGAGLQPDLLQVALTDAGGAERVPVEMRPAYTVAHALAATGDLPGARRVLDREYLDASERGDEAGLPILLWVLVLVETWAGDWDRAERLAEQGSAAAELSASPAGTAFIAAARATLRTCQGRVSEARADIATALGLAEQLRLTAPALFATFAAGLLELSLSDAVATHHVLGPGAEQLLAAGLAEPGTCLFVIDDIEALIRLNRLAEARRLLVPFAARADALGRDRARAGAARCRGLLLAADGALAQAEQELDVALEIGADLGLPFEQARTLFVAGEVHRRARHKRHAQERLTAARMIFDGLGATLWVARCDAELGRYRAPARTNSDALTVTEHQVASLAAAGKTTREIATAQFTSARTVEAHLQQVYRKLGVRSRVELSRHLADHGELT